jgi:hypothetical protein
MSDSFLPANKGFKFVPRKKKSFPVTLIPAGVTGEGEPAFVVTVLEGTVDDLNALAEAQAAEAPTKGFRPNSPQAKKLRFAWRDKYASKFMLDWSGLTPKNFEHINRGDLVLEAPAGSKDEIPFSVEAAVYLLSHTDSGEFGDLIQDAMWNRAREHQEKVEDAKNG